LGLDNDEARSLLPARKFVLLETGELIGRLVERVGANTPQERLLVEPIQAAVMQQLEKRTLVLVNMNVETGRSSELRQGRKSPCATRLVH